MTALYGAAEVIGEIRHITDTSAALRITGGEMFPDLSGNALCRVGIEAYCDGDSPDECLAVLEDLAAAARSYSPDSGTFGGIYRITPVSAAYVDRRDNGYIRFCQRFETVYKGGL